MAMAMDGVDYESNTDIHSSSSSDESYLVSPVPPPPPTPAEPPPARGRSAVVAVEVKSGSSNNGRKGGENRRKMHRQNDLPPRTPLPPSLPTTTMTSESRSAYGWEHVQEILEEDEEDENDNTDLSSMSRRGRGGGRGGRHRRRRQYPHRRQYFDGDNGADGTGRKTSESTRRLKRKESDSSDFSSSGSSNGNSHTPRDGQPRRRRHRASSSEFHNESGLLGGAANATPSIIAVSTSSSNLVHNYHHHLSPRKMNVQSPPHMTRLALMSSHSPHRGKRATSSSVSETIRRRDRLRRKQQLSANNRAVHYSTPKRIYHRGSDIDRGNSNYQSRESDTSLTRESHHLLQPEPRPQPRPQPTPVRTPIMRPDDMMKFRHDYYYDDNNIDMMIRSRNSYYPSKMLPVGGMPSSSSPHYHEHNDTRNYPHTTLVEDDGGSRQQQHYPQPPPQPWPTPDISSRYNQNGELRDRLQQQQQQQDLRHQHHHHFHHQHNRGHNPPDLLEENEEGPTGYPLMETMRLSQNYYDLLLRPPSSNTAGDSSVMHQYRWGPIHDQQDYQQNRRVYEDQLAFQHGRGCTPTSWTPRSLRHHNDYSHLLSGSNDMLGIPGVESTSARGGVEREGATAPSWSPPLPTHTMMPKTPDGLSISTFSASHPPSSSASTPGKSLFSFWLSPSTTTSSQQPRTDLFDSVLVDARGSRRDEQGGVDGAFDALTREQFLQQPPYQPWQQQQQHLPSKSDASIDSKSDYSKQAHQDVEFDGTSTRDSEISFLRQSLLGYPTTSRNRNSAGGSYLNHDDIQDDIAYEYRNWQKGMADHQHREAGGLNDIPHKTNPLLIYTNGK